jgi:hypothetical protein
MIMNESKLPLERKCDDKPKEREPRIDPDVPWHEEHNLNVARKLRVRWNGRGYVDVDGCQVLDRYGQPLG